MLWTICVVIACIVLVLISLNIIFMRRKWGENKKSFF